jgi:hypothetical protein
MNGSRTADSEGEQFLFNGDDVDPASVLED